MRQTVQVDRPIIGYADVAIIHARLNDKLAAAGLGDIALERLAAIGELGGNLGGRQIGQQCAGEQIMTAR